MYDLGRLLIGAFDSAAAAIEYATNMACVEPEVVGADWPRARAAFLAGSFTPSIETEELLPELEAELLERMQTTVFRASVQELSWRLARVPLAALVTSQPYVNLSRVNLMAERLQDAHAPLMFPTETVLNVRAEAADGPTIAFISDRRELTVTSAQATRDAETGALEVLVRIEPRPNYINILACEDRLIVRNGNHRLVAAWQAGLREVPCVVVAADRTRLGEAKWNKFAPEALFSTRPPLLKDVAAPAEACIEVKLRRRRFVTLVRAEQRAEFED